MRWRQKEREREGQTPCVMALLPSFFCKLCQLLWPQKIDKVSYLAKQHKSKTSQRFQL